MSPPDGAAWASEAGSGAVRGPLAVVLAGPPGGGKSTVAVRLARLMGGQGQPLAVLDQDRMTGPLTEVIAEQAGHLGDVDDPLVRSLSRQPRYEALLGVAGDVLRGGLGCILVAPFTGERRDPRLWHELEARLRSDGAGVVPLVWVTCPPDVLIKRLKRRRALRDRAKLADPAWVRNLDLAPPAVPHVRVDTSADLSAQLEALVAQLAAGLTDSELSP
jgi:predicted kinase